MTNEDKYAVNLKLISLNKPVSSLGAFRLLIILDIFIWLSNSYTLWVAVWWLITKAEAEILTILFCELLILWAIWLDINKIKLIELAKFEKNFKKFLYSRIFAYWFFFIYHTLSALFFGGVVVLSMFGKIEILTEKFMFADKIYQTTFMHKFLLLGGLLFMVFLHRLGLYGVGRMREVARFMVVEQEDVVVTAGGRDYLEDAINRYTGLDAGNSFFGGESGVLSEGGLSEEEEEKVAKGDGKKGEEDEDLLL
jgi:hypothetical protein